MLVGLGYRPDPEHLSALFRGAWIAEKCARDLGVFKRGTLKQIWASQAESWAIATGTPSYTFEQFRRAYAAWQKRTGGGIGRAGQRPVKAARKLSAK